MRYPGHLLACSVLAGLTLQAVPAAANPCLPDDLEVVQVIDVPAGDTLVLADGRTVRLAAIMAPRSLDPDAGTVASAARNALVRLVDAAQTLRLARSEKPPDRYGRISADLLLTDAEGNRIRVQERLLAEGHAILIDRSGTCAANLAAAEAAAMDNGAGLWSDPEFAVVNANDPTLGGRTGLYIVVEGRIASVGTRTYMTFLDYGMDYRRDFTAMLTPKLVETLAETGVMADALAGRRVEVRGIVEESGGPAIRLRHAGDLRVLDE